MPMTAVHIDGGRVLGGRARQEDVWGFGDVPDGVWAAVADGMGGHRDGDRAASAAIDALIAHCHSAATPLADIRAWMQVGVTASHRAVQALAGLHDATAAPGTTLLWAVALGDTCWMTHIGDSRAYLVRSDQVEPLTIDMTPAGQRVREGQEPWNHQNTAHDAHGLLSCLGHTPLVAEIFSFSWEPGDVLILTTDGLNGVPLQRWPDLVRGTRSVDQILALAPWQDNATLVLMRHA